MAICLIFLISSNLSAQIFSGDILNESPLTAIPNDMTYEEFEDMNRRISVGLMLSAIPFPGVIHSYAGEKEEAKKIRRRVGIGAGIALAGIILMEEKDFPESDYQLYTINAGEDNERRYEKIPIGIDGANTQYKLKELHRDSEGLGQFLVPIGVGFIAWQYIKDYYYGIKTIEEKRNKVRYKYGLKLQSSVSIQSKSIGMGLSYNF